MIDIILLLLCLIIILIGSFKGFTYLFLNFFSLSSSIYIAYKFNSYMYSVLKNLFNANDIVIKILSFLSLFLFVSGTFTILHKLIDKYICKNTKLHLTDRLVGFLTGLFLSALLLYIIALYSQKNDILHSIVKSSEVIKYINSF